MGDNRPVCIRGFGMYIKLTRNNRRRRVFRFFEFARWAQPLFFWGMVIAMLFAAPAECCCGASPMDCFSAPALAPCFITHRSNDHRDVTAVF